MWESVCGSLLSTDESLLFTRLILLSTVGSLQSTGRSLSVSPLSTGGSLSVLGPETFH